tara:strand:+ start:274 stop:2925 length:2652 start_codon:yes stop_codon:yes gene_type:complete
MGGGKGKSGKSGTGSGNLRGKNETNRQRFNRQVDSRIKSKNQGPNAAQSAYKAGYRGWSVGQNGSWSGGNVGDPNSPAAQAYKARHGEAAYSSYAKQYQASGTLAGPSTSKMSLLGDLPNISNENSLFGVNYSQNFEKGKESFFSKLTSSIGNWRGLDGKGMTLGEKFSNPTGAVAESFTGDKNYFTTAANQQRMMDRAIASNERIYGKDWKTKLGYDKLSPGQYQDAMIGGMTEDHTTNTLAVLGTAGLIKAAPAVLSGLGSWYNKGRLTGNMNVGQLLKNDWGHRGGFTGPAGKGGWDVTRGFRTLNPAKGGLLSGPTEAFRRAAETGVLGPVLGGAGALGWGIGSTVNKGIESLSNNPAVRGALSSVFNRTPIGMVSNLTQNFPTNTDQLNNAWTGGAVTNFVQGIRGIQEAIPDIKRADGSTVWGNADNLTARLLKAAKFGPNMQESYTDNVLNASPYKSWPFYGPSDLSINEEIAAKKEKALATYGAGSPQDMFWSNPQNVQAWQKKIIKDRSQRWSAHTLFGDTSEEGDAFRDQAAQTLGLAKDFMQGIDEMRADGWGLDDIQKVVPILRKMSQESDTIPNLKMSPFGIDSIKNLFAKTYVGDSLGMASADEFIKSGKFNTLDTLINMSKGEPREKIDQLMKLAGYYQAGEEFIKNPIEGIQSRLGIDTGEQGRRREQRIRNSGSNPFPNLNIDPRIGQQLSQQMYQQGNWDLSNLWREQEISDRLYSEEIARIQGDQSLYDKQLAAIQGDLANYDAELARVQGQGAEWGDDPEYKKYLDQITSNQKSLSDYLGETTQHKSDLDAYMAKYTSNYNVQKADTKSRAIQYEQLMASSNRRPVSGIRMARQGWNYNASPTTAFNRRFRNKNNLTTQSINV